ncbi:hypothetical protein DL89DRAFT_256064 [Linderina pennispora]|uniref:Uncharacterized protein n=1 Tax=Linderina pennispora TaxID=61395 RepID=A0A1Y1WG20_9FUNG|nr:uncharacterized protein DL89DRAFT_256064 [Linderina pennispora]ORX72437.1 hypothetical protein DL89DRAFT_256064 [Linderina pennispora]
MDQTSSKRKSSLPTVSLQEIINSLLEENRVDEGVRFLNSVSPMAVLNNKKLVSNLLAMFKPTDVLEEDLKQRGSFLLQALEKSSTDTSKVWKVDDERRKSIVQAQHLILTYLVPVKQCPEEFLDLLDELTTMPADGTPVNTVAAMMVTAIGDSGPDSTTKSLGDGMYLAGAGLDGPGPKYRLGLGLRIHADCLRRLLCLLDRVSYPARLLEAISTRFNAVLDNRHNPLEQKIASLLLDLVAIATSCGTISRFECVQRIAKLLAEKDTDQQSAAHRSHQIRPAGC